MYGATEALLRSYSVPWVPSWAGILLLAAVVYWFAEVSQMLLLTDVMGVAAQGPHGPAAPPLRLLVAGLANAVASLLGLLLLAAMRLSGLAQPGAKGAEAVSELTWPQLACLACAGVAEGLGLGLASKSLQYTGPLTRTFIDSTGVLITQAAALICGLDSFHHVRFLALFAFVLGGVVATCNEQETDSATGIVLRFASLVFAAGQMVLLQLPLRWGWSVGGQQPHALTRIKMMAVMKPASCVSCLVLSLVWERAHFLAFSNRLVVLCVVLGDLAAFATFCELTVLSNASVLTWQVLVTLAMIPLTASGVLFAGEHATAWQWVGFGVWTAGALIYLRIRWRECPPPDEKEEP